MCSLHYLGDGRQRGQQQLQGLRDKNVDTRGILLLASGTVTGDACWVGGDASKIESWILLLLTNH